MKTRNYFKLFLIISISVLSFTGCIKTEDEPKVDYYKVMTDYMAANKMDLPDVIASGVTTAAAVCALILLHFILLTYVLQLILLPDIFRVQLIQPLKTFHRCSECWW